jgi:preprotein translocase subunit YajC
VGALIIILVLLVLMWLLLIRPQRRKQQEQQDLLSNVQIGDEIVTAGGIYGTIVEVEDTEVTVEIAENTNVRMAKRAIAGIVNEEDDEDEEYEDEDDEEYEDDEAEEDGEPEAEAHETGEHDESEAEDEDGKEAELDRPAAEQRG